MLKRCLGIFLGLLISTVNFAIAVDYQTLEECDAKKLMTFFPVEFVNEALRKFNVPQSEWEGINAELATKDNEVIRKIEEKAAQLNPNPLNDPTQIAVTFKLFRQSLLEVFGGVMAGHGVSDAPRIAAMLKYIQDLKRQRFQSCLDKGAIQDPDNILPQDVK